MAVKWTEEQQQVISLRNRNLLVSAAAGSGKTAVLVERILSRITDPVHPIDIDRLLVVTFTRAAAGEMKDRIGRELEKRLEEDPGNTHLQRQGVLLDHAQISTIDGFCTFVLQNYFHRIGLDPGYRIAEEEELKIVRTKVLDDLLEEEYVAAAEQEAEASGKVSGGQNSEISGNSSSEPKTEMYGTVFSEEREADRQECGGAAFRAFMKTYGGLKNDAAAAELILRIHTFASADPDPDEWLERCLKAYEAETTEELEQLPWMRQVLEEADHLLESLRADMQEMVRFTEEHAEAPQVYLPSLRSEAAYLESICAAESFRGKQERISVSGFGRLSGARVKEGEDPDLRKRIQARRNAVKKSVADLKESVFPLTLEEVLKELKGMRPHAAECIRLVRRFDRAFTEAKRKKNLVDFSDLEHLALQVLTEKQEDGSRKPTEAAIELAGRFEEVMIDEYQDSNYLQEALLSSVSRTEPGRQNRFMVGDVKQSIYGFRQARPDMFVEKSRTYLPLVSFGEQKTAAPEPASENSREEIRIQGTAGIENFPENQKDHTPVRIDLHKNFRSRPGVLDGVNAVFSRLMIEELGGINYDDAAALHAGASYPDLPQKDLPETELLVIDKDDALFAESAEDIRTEIEARAAAREIKNIVRNGRVWDAKKEAWRPVMWRDCVILMRAGASKGDIFVHELQEEGIPAYAVSGRGYFLTVEVMTVLNILRICDNPLQDIPLAAVLRSPVVGLSDAELAQIRIAGKQGSLYDALCSFIQEEPDEGNRQNCEDESPYTEISEGSYDSLCSYVRKECKEDCLPEERNENSLRNKIAVFLELLLSFRKRIPHTPIHILITQILEETGYGEYAAAMPAGAQRRANLDMLIERAVSYEKTGFHGLFSFIRYVEDLEYSNVDFGEVNLYGEEENIVRIMTIHKSKGLEFPVVILAGIGNRFNRQDESGNIIMHASVGLGMSAIYPKENRKHQNTLIRVAVRDAVRRDMLAEELRVLYVAMTRAKEK
ncbi:MAG: UvrD-helicase domain-containing protein, partial [Eubacterium sp.]|nr:UvrD-helicase domain-containing protein [Eubacterium sp.]